MPAVTAAVPTLSQIQAWSTDHLETAATHWTRTAHTWENAFTTIHLEAPYPGGTLWQGEAAEAAMLRTGSDRAVVVGAADSLHSAASAARYGADEIVFARQLALEAVAEARAAGFTVGEDLSVTSQMAGPPALQAVRQAQAHLLAAEIRARAEALVTVDTEVAVKVSSATAGVNAAQFGGTPVTAPPKKKPEIQAVDNRPEPQSPFPNQPDPPPAPVGPSGDDIRRVLDKLPVGDSPEVREVRTQQDLDNLWNWLEQNGVERPGGYGPKPGVMKNLPDGTIVGRREAADSTKLPALDINVPGEGYTKVHINPRGGVPEIPAPVRPAPVELPKPVEGPIRGSAPVEGSPLEGLPKIGEMPILGGPGTPIGPTFVHPPHSLRHPPILGDPWEDEE
jgi:hypothetical protein